MPKRKYYDEVYSEIKSISENDYELISTEYINSKTKLSIKHISCGHIFEMRLNNFLNGQRCPICSKKHSGELNKIGIEKFTQQIYELTNGEYIVLSENYISNKHKIKFKHITCGMEFKTTPNNFKKTLSCPHCSYKKRAENRKHSLEYVSEFISITTNAEYEFVDTDYKNTSTKFKVKHIDCGNTFDVNFGNFSMGSRCPFCFNSKGEKSIKDILLLRNIEFETQYEFKDLIGIGGRKLRFDFAIFQNGILLYLLEYDGKFHFEKVHLNHDFERQLIHDSFKNEYCIKNNIKLIRIPYWEFNNINIIIDNLTI